MKLYIAEKPSVGKAIAASLSLKSPTIQRTREYIKGKDWCVAWAAGHLFELEEPDFYIKKVFPNAVAVKSGRLRWDLDHLPITPSEEEWSSKLVSKTAPLFRAIRDLIKQATVVVHAGDADRAGQQIVDNILDAVNYKKPVKRVLVTSLDVNDVTKALGNEKDNRDFRPLSDSEQCRSRADWLYGMNFSRAVTMKAQENGYGSVISIGRVQTAVLSLVVARDNEIANFVAKDYFVPVANLTCQTGAFKAKWKPLRDQDGVDEEGRLLDQRVAYQLQATVTGKNGVVSDYKDEIKTQGAPMPFSLAKLQALAGKKYGYSAEKVLQTVQSLYETYKSVTYPRVDTGYLPESMHGDAKMILDKVTGTLSLPANVVSHIDSARKSYAWNDKKVTAHHGIIPTASTPNLTNLSEAERNLYREIAIRYAAQFMPPRKYRAVSLVVDVNNEKFATSGSTTVDQGWRVIYGADDVRQDDDEGVSLPPVSKGDTVHCSGLDIESKKTQPPRPFVESALLTAMVHIHRFVTNPKVKAIFESLQKKADSVEEAGIGTPATRHTFLPRLIKVGLLTASKQGRSKELVITSTDVGRALISALPSSLAKPDMTALWEATLSDVAEGTKNKEEFMAMQRKFVERTLEQIKAMDIILPSKGKSRSQASGSTIATDKSCPKCNSILKVRSGSNGPFLGCSGYPGCKHTERVDA